MTEVTATLTDFLLARIAEDEEVARVAWPARWEQDDGRNAVRSAETGLRGGYEDLHMGVAHLAMTVGNYQAEARNAKHVARHDPARVLAECEAKRRIVEFVDGWFADQAANHEVIRHLAAVYADHPDYRPEWRP